LEPKPADDIEQTRLAATADYWLHSQTLANAGAVSHWVRAPRLRQWVHAYCGMHAMWGTRPGWDDTMRG
jgi:hypothetical protein